jgi:S-adenosyl-L-methionine hydrolase (adenosine-forming)
MNTQRPLDDIFDDYTNPSRQLVSDAAPSNKTAIITLTTDFGVQDTFVGAMKGVMVGIAPNAAIVDLCHHIPAQDILAGALALQACDAFPDGAIHVAVVDPEVGTRRSAIAIRTRRRFFVGPDNGIFTAVLEKDPPIEMVRLTNADYFRRPICSTFHARDIFAPVAAHIASGVRLSELGEHLKSLRRISIPTPGIMCGDLVGEVLRVDRFGNLITNIRRSSIEAWAGGVDRTTVRIFLGPARILGIDRTYADVEPGTLVAYFGSDGFLEVACRNSDAARALGVERGEEVRLQRD